MPSSNGCADTSFLERYDRGYITTTVGIDSHGLSLLPAAQDDNGVKRMLTRWATVGPRFDAQDIVSVNLEPSEDPEYEVWAKLKVRRGSRVLGTFVAMHANPTVSHATLEPDEISVVCKACGTELTLMRDSLERVPE